MVEVLVISDVHLGTVACNANELLTFLKGIFPEVLVLNGDFIDAWRFSRNYFPKSHLKIIRYIIKLMEKGTKVYYITGNHDEIFRKFENTRSGNFEIVNQLVLDLDGKKTWILHGDIFDPVIYKMKWLSKLGAAAYGFFSVINSLLNLAIKPLTGHQIKLQKRLKKGFSFNSRNITRFEKQVASIAMKKKFQAVICGHTHIPAEKFVSAESESIKYLNCGDWVENNSALEYSGGQWRLEFFKLPEHPIENQSDDLLIPDQKQIHQDIFEFNYSLGQNGNQFFG